jgi:hypothetical protein
MYAAKVLMGQTRLHPSLATKPFTTFAALHHGSNINAFKCFE